ncbi:hypothetical protein SAMN05216349_103196 [Oribacterium sp. KHPX15]|uniref:hypothetical protein n=1 Tax=unclassified Oribacterium TaxID=2629782 RepID=UPI0004E18555|nr:MULTISPECIES: hypothetical protein [unclassified Oribacterium]SEA00773.1 hypothetical protein SAMN05216349_103196 [Oribacterium sp. KHPX15]
MELIIFYAVALMFGAVGGLFFYYPFQQGYDTKEKILYISIGTFFAALSFSMFTKNVVLGGTLLTLLMGGATLGYGVYESYSIITHHIKTEGKLVNIDKHHSSKGSVYYSLNFKLEGDRETYTVDHISFTKKYVIGNTYNIFISNHDHAAYIHRIGPFFLSILCIIMGIIWFQLIPELLCK